jgi:arylsulfatase A-like enzyme
MSFRRSNLVATIHIALALLWGSSTPLQARGASADARPNVLRIIADDWSWPHAQAYGCETIKTPHFNELASKGVLFHNAFTAAPTCTASRGALLTGQHPHRLEEGANLWSILPARFATYPDILATKGYFVGQSGKGWGPGSLDGSGRTHNPAGPTFASFEAFLKKLPSDAPFCYWHGSQDPHRPYEKGTGLAAGFDPKTVKVPTYLPDTPEIRSDLLDYLFEVKRFDDTVGQILDLLERTGRAENTIVIVTSDNGLPFPRSKANLYDSGTRIPLVISWPKRIKQSRSLHDLVSLVDVAPTLIEAAGLPPEPKMTGKSLLDLLTEGKDPVDPTTGKPKYDRSFVIVERERHAYVREGNLGYPARGLRTKTELYIRNFEPTRHPAGDPEPVSSLDRAKALGLSKDPFARMALALRPARELFDVTADPDDLRNVWSGEKGSALDQTLTKALADLGDPRAKGPTDFFDKGPYVGARAAGPAARRAGARQADNTLTELEKRVGWRLLFDGVSHQGWTTEKKQPGKTPIQDGAINPHKAGGYMLIHEEPLENFVLTLDFKISPKCNSGVFFRTWPLEPRPGKDVGFNGLEIAIDDTQTADYHDTGALYDLVAPVQNAMKPVGQWNHLVLVADGADILIEINGHPVTRTRLSDWTQPNKRPDGTSHKFDIAYKEHPRKGYIGLQDHGSDCWYKNIKVLKLR